MITQVTATRIYHLYGELAASSKHVAEAEAALQRAKDFLAAKKRELAEANEQARIEVNETPPIFP